MDVATTGLLYLGNGQYYDPQTGRFLNRNANPNSTNPYAPWNGDPTSALVAPLALLSLLYSRKKKRSKLDTYVILLVLCAGVSMSLTACNLRNYIRTPTATLEITATSTPTPTAPFDVEITATITPTNTLSPSGTPTVTPTTTCTSTGTPSSIDYQLKYIYQVGVSDDFPEEIKPALLAAVKAVDQKFADTMGWAATQSFSRVYGIGFLFNYGECGSCDTAWAFTQNHRIDFRDFFRNETQDTRFITHELGHGFDYKVCAAVDGKPYCWDTTNGAIYKKLNENVATMPFLNRHKYGSDQDNPPYSGFAGGKFDWQFTASGQTSFSRFHSEVWADMFLGWTYGKMGSDRLNYMNAEMPVYLGHFN